MFEKKLNFSFEITQKTLQDIAHIDQFKGRWAVLEERENVYLKELRRIATIQSVGSSTRIEGAKLSDDEVKQLLENVQITKFETRDEQEVIGYYDVLELILESAKEIKLSESFIKQLHGLLLKYSTKDSGHRGEYKTLPNTVTAHYPDGTTRVIFSPTPPYLVKKEMEELIKWVNESFSNQNIHPLLITGLFIYEILSIHPFQDGNGRLSRLLTTLLLLKQDYNFCQYISFEHIIENRKKQYFEALMNSQKRRKTEASEIIDEWIEFFIDCLKDLIQRLEEKYNIYRKKGVYLNERRKLIVNHIKKAQPVKMGDIQKILSHVSVNTLKKDIKYLVEQSILDKIVILFK